MKERKMWIIALVAIMVFAATSFAATDENWVGTYRGTFVGRDDYGAFVISINQNGYIDGTGRSQVFMSQLDIEGEVRMDKSVEFYVVQGGERPIIFTGTIDFMNRIIGKWAYNDNSAQGSFYAMPNMD
ncbi:MAG: hypothetical protein ACLFN0_08295 [Thermovirgaceae bacterium]